MSARRTSWVLIVIVLAGCHREGRDQEACFPDAPILTYALPPVRSVLEVEPQEMLDAVRRQEPLKPDRRILFAVAEIEGLLTGADPGEVHAEYSGGRWEVRYHGERVGVLPAIPDFEEALQFLEAWGLDLARRRSIGPAHSIDQAQLASIEADLAEFHSMDVANALRRLDEVWRESGGDARLLAPAARGLVYLTLQAVNRLENGDPLAAKALATLSLARALTGDDLSREEALLADYMGYAAHALRVTKSLPADDPARSYVASRDQELRGLAERPDADRLTRFLYAKRLARERDQQEWRNWVAEHALPPEVSLSAFQSGFRVGRFDITRNLSEVYPYLALLELWRATGEHPVTEAASFDGRSERSLAEAIEAIREEIGRDPADLVARFEVDLARLADRYPGPFLDSSAYGAFFASNFYSGLHVAAMHRLDNLASAPAAERFASGLEGSPGPVGGQLQRWLAHLAESDGGRPDTTRMMADLDGLHCLGERPLTRTFEALDQRLGYGDLRRPEAVRRVARHLDTRPDHQHAYASIARDGLDLETGETYYRNVVRVAAPAYRATEAWMARFDGDTARLAAMIEEPDLAIEYREDALRYLIGGRFGGDDYIRKSAELLIAADPDRWSLRDTYIEYLEVVGAHEDGIPVVEEWLRDHTRDDGFPWIFARTALARLHYKAGRYERAMRTISPVVGSWQGGALGRAALILERLGRSEQARGMAAEAVERYPNSAYQRSVLAELLWQQGRYDEVVEVLNDEHQPIDAWDWRHDVADAFLRVFADRPLEDAGEAFAVLIRGGIPSWVTEGLPRGLMRAGRPDLAFTLQSQLEATSAIGSLRHPINAYQYLKVWKGERVALDWIRSRIPAGVLSDASQVMFQERAGELLWELIPDPERTAYPPGLWLMRAAAFVLSRDTDPRRRQALLDYYRTPSADDYVAMGRYLVGLESQDRLLARARTPERRCEIAYYIGLKAEGERRYHDAAGWYRVVLATGQTKEYEYPWALDALSSWKNSARSLAFLEGADTATVP